MLVPVLAPVAVLATGAAASALAVARPTGPEHVRITVSPRIVAPYDSATIDVSGVTGASAVEVRLVGASGVRGARLPWLPLQRRKGSWTGRLPQPVFAGIYPIQLRTRPPLPIAPGPATYLRVYWEGTSRLPLFRSPERAVDWWVTHVAGGTLVAIRRWAPQAIDHRLTLLHRLFVVSYTPNSRPTPADRLGAWITTVREGSRGGWRVLEAGVTPP